MASIQKLSNSQLERHLSAKISNMFSKTTIVFFCLVSCYILSCVLAAPGGGGGHGHHKVTIHVPIHEKTIKHTHTKHVTVHHGHGGGHQEEEHGHGGWGEHFHSDPFGGDHHH